MKKDKEINLISRKSNIVLTTITGLFSLACIYPVLLLIAVSFSDEKALFLSGYKLIPAKFSLAAYKFIFTQDTGMGRSYLVTIAVTVMGTILALTLCSLMSYPLSRQGFKYRHQYSFFVFFTMMFNGGLVSSYIINTQYLHLTNTIWALVLPGAANAFNIILLRSYFASNVPDEIVEAAKIDGAGEFATFIRIVVPISGPGIATIALFETIQYWNAWFGALLYINDNNMVPLQLLLMRIQNQMDYITKNLGSMSPQEQSDLMANLPMETVRMAMVVLAIGPIVLAYPYFQKYFVKGITIGAVKG